MELKKILEYKTRNEWSDYEDSKSYQKNIKSVILGAKKLLKITEKRKFKSSNNALSCALTNLDLNKYFRELRILLREQELKNVKQSKPIKVYKKLGKQNKRNRDIKITKGDFEIICKNLTEASEFLKISKVKVNQIINKTKNNTTGYTLEVLEPYQNKHDMINIYLFGDYVETMSYPEIKKKYDLKSFELNEYLKTKVRYYGYQFFRKKTKPRKVFFSIKYMPLKVTYKNKKQEIFFNAEEAEKKLNIDARYLIEKARQKKPLKCGTNIEVIRESNFKMRNI